jgi:hypothetical protein
VRARADGGVICLYDATALRLFSYAADSVVCGREPGSRCCYIVSTELNGAVYRGRFALFRPLFRNSTCLFRVLYLVVTVLMLVD